MIQEGLNDTEKALALALNDYFIKYVIEARNKIMASRVIDLLNENPGTSFVFAFGAFHFIGNNTVLDYLQSEGYNITQIGPNDELPSNPERDVDLLAGFRNYVSSWSTYIKDLFFYII